MRSHLRSTLSFVIGWPLSLIALFFILKLIFPHIDEIRSSLTTINYWMMAIGTLCFLTYYFLRSSIYQKILSFLGYSLSLRESAFYWGQSELQRYIPGNIWSFLGRSVLFSRKQVEKKDIATSLIVESQQVLIGTCLATLFGVPYLLRTFIPDAPFRQFLFPASILIVGCMTLLYIYSHRYGSKIKSNVLRRVFISPFTPEQNLILTFQSIICYLFFGLGYFFVMGSIFSLHPQLLWELLGFFVFSLLAGYLSILTPTGLGIREGILIFGLRSIASTAVVGLASILTRVILIISEVMYLFFTYLWHRTKNRRLIQLETFFSENKHLILLFIGIVLFIVYFSLISFLRYDNFYTGRFDLGNMAQTVWNTYHGRIFQLTDPNGTENISRLAFHADFLLILLAPLYAIWENPKMLLLVQAIITGLGAYFVYTIVAKIIKGRTLPLILAFLYLINPGVQRATIYDFHAVTLATTFLLAAFYFLLSKRRAWFLVFLLLAALTKEELWLMVAFFGVYIALVAKNFKRGAALFLFGVGMFFFLVSYAIPHSAGGSQHFALSYYSDFGDSPAVIAKNIILSPHITLPLLFEKSRTYYFQQLLGPVGFLSLLSPFYLLFAAVDVAIGVLSSNPQLRQIYYQYTTPITPFIFIAAIYGIKRLRDFFPGLPRLAIGIYLVVMGVMTAYLYGPLPGSREPNLAMITKPQKHAELIDAYMARLPDTYTITASNNLGSHLSHRPSIYTLPIGADTADIVAILHDPTTAGSDDYQTQLISKLKSDSGYLIFYELDDFIVFKKIQE